MKNLRYIIVSPVKDEERHVEYTLKSVTSQTLKPVLWVVVNDGSKDSTSDIVNRYANEYPFMMLVDHHREGARQSGAPVIRAFNQGYQSIGETDYDFIVKLDSDLSFEPDYFEKLLGRFLDDRRLGIASGVYLEMDKAGMWREVAMPFYHAAGACKVLRRRCFEEIGGFITSAGWDTVDEIRAMYRGWKTGHFRDLQMKHHKAEGSGVGAIKTSVMHGEIYYLTGGDKLFFMLKVLHRLMAKPYLLGAFALLWGYMKASAGRKSLLVTISEANCYKALLLERLRTQVKTVFASC